MANRGFSARIEANSIRFRSPVAMVTYPRMLSAASVRGMLNAITAFKDGMFKESPEEHPELQVNFTELSALMGLPELDAMEQRYTASED